MSTQSTTPTNTDSKTFKAGSFTLNGPQILSFEDLRDSIDSSIKSATDGGTRMSALDIKNLTDAILHDVQTFINVECPVADKS